MKFFRGFTLIEILLVFSILTIMFGVGAPAYHTFMVRNDLDIATVTLVQTLRRAQTLSQVADGDSIWGVHVQTGVILLYKGPSYTLRDATFDEETAIPTSIVITGLSDVTFSKLTGLPQSVGTTIFTSTTNETRNITINQKGTVDY